MAGGYSNKEIAHALGTAEGTIKNQVSSILSKFGVRDRTKAVLKALRSAVAVIRGLAMCSIRALTQYQNTAPRARLARGAGRGLVLHGLFEGLAEIFRKVVVGGCCGGLGEIRREKALRACRHRRRWMDWFTAVHDPLHRS